MTDHDNKPNGSATPVNIREFFTLWLTNIDRFLEERDRRYDTRFEGQEKAVAAALAAADKQVTTAFAASEKAVLKSEEAQREYNIRSNEFRGQLDDQAKTLMPRTEALSRFDAIDKRSEETKLRLDNDIVDLRNLIGNLRESRSEGVGSNVALHDTRNQSNIDTTRLITIVVFAVGATIGIVEFVIKNMK